MTEQEKLRMYILMDEDTVQEVALSPTERKELDRLQEQWNDEQEARYRNQPPTRFQ